MIMNNQQLITIDLSLRTYIIYIYIYLQWSTITLLFYMEAAKTLEPWASNLHITGKMLLGKRTDYWEGFTF